MLLNSTKTLLTLSLLFVGLISTAQSTEEVEKALQKFDKLEDLNKYYERYPDWQIEIMEAKTDGGKPKGIQIGLLKGEVVTGSSSSGTYSYKLLKADSVRQFRVRYIMFNGAVLSDSEVDSLQQLVIGFHEKGRDFAELARRYSMDGGENEGDLGWFDQGKMPPALEAAIMEHQQGDVFTVSIPDTDIHYVILKTHSDKLRLALTIVKVKSEG